MHPFPLNWIIYPPVPQKKPNYIYLINAHMERFSCQKKMALTAKIFAKI